MNELTVVEKASEWLRMKSLVLDSVSSAITKRVYNMALDEFFAWYELEPRPGFSKATVSAWRVTLEERGLGSSSIIVRMSAIRKLAVEATDNGLLAPELAAGIARVKSAKSIGVRTGNWLSLRQAQALLNPPGRSRRASEDREFHVASIRIGSQHESVTFGFGSASGHRVATLVAVGAAGATLANVARQAATSARMPQLR